MFTLNHQVCEVPYFSKESEICVKFCSLQHRDHRFCSFLFNADVSGESNNSVPGVWFVWDHNSKSENVLQNDTFHDCPNLTKFGSFELMTYLSLMWSF